MAAAWLVPVVAGVMFAGFFLAVAGGSPGALILGYLAPLPMFAVGLGWGLRAAALAGVIALILVGLAGGILSVVSMAALLVGPALLLVRQALLARSAADGSLEWYPPGLLVTWLIGIGAALFMAGVFYLGGGEVGIEERLRRAFGAGLAGMAGGIGREQVEAVVLTMAAFPSIIVVSWMAMMVANAALAQGVLVRFGRNLRPSPKVADLELPRPLAIVTAGVAVPAVLLDGWLGFVGQNLLVILGVAFFFAGLAVVHHLARRSGQRFLLLIGFYVFLVVFGWPIVLVALLGLVDQWAQLRRRIGGGSASGS